MTGGASEFFDLARDFEKAPAKVAIALYAAWKDGGNAFAEDWAGNARETAGEHGKLYPDSITSETRASLGIEVVTGPESGRPQGGMGEGFEYGSQNQPPHLDGLRALPIAERRLDRLSDSAITFAIP